MANIICPCDIGQDLSRLSFNVRTLSARRATSEPDPRQTFGRLDLLLKRSKL